MSMSSKQKPGLYVTRGKKILVKYEREVGEKVAEWKKPLREDVCPPGCSPVSKPPFKVGFWVHITGV